MQIYAVLCHGTRCISGEWCATIQQPARESRCGMCLLICFPQPSVSTCTVAWFAEALRSHSGHGGLIPKTIYCDKQQWSKSEKLSPLDHAPDVLHEPQWKVNGFGTCIVQCSLLTHVVPWYCNALVDYIGLCHCNTTGM